MCADSYGDIGGRISCIGQRPPYGVLSVLTHYTLSFNFLEVLLTLLIPCMIHFSTSAMS